MECIATNSVTRYGTSSLSKEVAYQVKIIHDHQTGTKSPRKRSTPSAFGSWCSPRASAATATTKHRSKKSSSQVDFRSSARASLVRLRIACGRTKREEYRPSAGSSPETVPCFGASVMAKAPWRRRADARRCAGPQQGHPLPIARQVVGFSRRVDAEQELVSVVRVVEERVV